MVLTAALALGALPGLAGSRTPSPAQAIEAAAFQAVFVPAFNRSATAVDPLDAAHRSAGVLAVGTPLSEPGIISSVPALPAVTLPSVTSGWSWKPARYSLSGYASFYDNGTTAMRLPRGTVIVICGAGGCLERTVTDYGPQLPARVVDMYRPDFFSICGCPSWSGVVWVTVRIY